MAPFVPAMLEAPVDARADTSANMRGRSGDSPARAGSSPVARIDIRISVHEGLSAIEREWRDFERRADGTVFQTYEWLATWHRHIGARRGTRPAVVIARDARGAMLMLLPLAIEHERVARRLTWLGGDLCDYNAPLLIHDFSLQVSIARFRQLWDEVLARLGSHPRLGFDLIDLEQMPETVGAQHNPMLQLGVTPHRDSAYIVSLAESWEKLYAKRSSATRRHDRAKRNKLAERGEIRVANTVEPHEIAQTLDTLMAQKGRWFADMGVDNIFARPGVREFFLDIATDPACPITHVSRLEVGGATVATNFGLMFGDCYYHVLASYDRGSDLARFGPGAVHLHELMRYAIGLGLRNFDLSVGNERYKHEWCDRELKLYDHVAISNARGACAALPIIVVRWVKGWIKRNPPVWNAYRKLRATIGSVRPFRSFSGSTKAAAR